MMVIAEGMMYTEAGRYSAVSSSPMCRFPIQYGYRLTRRGNNPMESRESAESWYAASAHVYRRTLPSAAICTDLATLLLAQLSVWRIYCSPRAVLQARWPDSANVIVGRLAVCRTGVRGVDTDMKSARMSHRMNKHLLTVDQ